MALVTGGTGGIGSAIVRDLVAAGCHVVVASTNESKFQKTFSKLSSEKVRWAELDMRASSDVLIETLNSAVDIYGALPNLWVFAAGVHSPKRDLTFLNATTDDYDSVVGMDLEATGELALCAVNLMVVNGVPGRIVVISSSTSGEPAWSPYRVAKWGCNAFVRDMAPKLAKHNIGIWALCPGPCATPLLGYNQGKPINLHDMQEGRYVMPEEVSPYVISLLAAEQPIGSGESIFISSGRGTFDIR